MNFDPAKASAEIARVWDRGSTVLWPVAIASFSGFVVLSALALTRSPPYVQANNIASPWFLIVSIGFAIFAVLKQYQERTVQTVHLFPIEVQSFCHRAVQNDGSVTTQIAIHMEVFNISEKPIWLPDVKLLRPKTHAPVLVKIITIGEEHLSLPPGEKAEGQVLLIIQADLAPEIVRRGISLYIQDQLGHKHKLKLPNIRTS